MRRMVGMAVVLGVCLLGALPTWATDHYVRDGGVCTVTCNAWNDAYDQLSSAEAAAVRGDTIYLADGTYAAVVLNTAASGSTRITIKKCSASDHGTETGYLSTYCDGQAVISGDIQIYTDNWTITGSYRNESDWGDGNAYGIRTTTVSSDDGQQSPNVCADNVILSYLNLGGAEGASFTGSEPDYAIYNQGRNGPNTCFTWTIDHNYLHNIAHFTMIQFNGTDGTTVEYTLFKNGWGKEALRGQSLAKNLIIRWNQFHDACGNTGAPGEGCSSEIAIWDGGANAFDGNQIYGNIFFRTRDENTQGTISVGGDGAFMVGSPANNTLVYNNTIAGIDSNAGGGDIIINGGTGNTCRNNLWYDVVGTPTCRAEGGSVTSSNNGEVGSDPFVSYATGNLHLTGATAAGFTLASPYNVDMDGVTRAVDGVWDRGAYEYCVTCSLTRTGAFSGGINFSGGVKVQ